MNPALQYAEVKLGVHTCYEAAQAARNELDEILTALDKAQDERRTLTESIADREVDILNEEWGKHSDMAASRMDQHVKIAKRKDALLSSLRTKHNEVAGTINGLEFDADMQRLQIKIQIARMDELGGYLNYLAAIKQAELTKKTTITENQ